MTSPACTYDGGSAVRRGVLAALLAFGLWLCGSASAQWTQFGGPDQSFAASSKGLAKTWPADGPKKIWSRDLGEGYSTILVDGGRLFTMYRSDEKERIVCLDAATGRTLWEHAYESEPRQGHGEQFGRGPRSTPLITGGRLYAVGVGGMMHCLDASSGSVLWSHDFRDDLCKHTAFGGYTSSPIEYKDTIIVMPGGEGDALVALDKKTGAVVWKNLDFENGYSTPKIMTIHGEDQLVTFMAAEVIGADPDTGALLWQYPYKNSFKENIVMPVAVGENTIVVSSPEVGTTALKITQIGEKFGVEKLWSTKKIQLYHGTAAVVGNHMYGVTGVQGPFFMSALNLETGKVAWRKRGIAKSNVVTVDGRLLLLEEDGRLILATPSPDDFAIDSEAQLLQMRAWTAPTIVGKTMYVRDEKQIMAVDLG